MLLAAVNSFTLQVFVLLTRMVEIFNPGTGPKPSPAQVTLDKRYLAVEYYNVKCFLQADIRVCIFLYCVYEIVVLKKISADFLLSR